MRYRCKLMIYAHGFALSDQGILFGENQGIAPPAAGIKKRFFFLEEMDEDPNLNLLAARLDRMNLDRDD